MGFLDLNGGLGRRFGSIGLSLEKPATRLTAWKDGKCMGEGPTAERALGCARIFIERSGIAGGVRLQIEEAIPEHAGLGSGTQLALAVGMAIAKLYDLPITIRDIAALTGRGARSGIGVGAFENGGLLLDGGRGRDTLVPPIVARVEFPSAWRVLLVLDGRIGGVHGKDEIKAFNALPEFPSELAASMCRRILMQALPALAEQNLSAFGAAITEIQHHVGDFFAPLQGGRHYVSPDIADAMSWLIGQGVCCTGQSSWGPTGFGIVSGEEEAVQLRNALEQRYSEKSLRFVMCGGRNEGGVVCLTPQNK